MCTCVYIDVGVTSNAIPTTAVVRQQHQHSMSAEISNEEMLSTIAIYEMDKQLSEDGTKMEVTMNQDGDLCQKCEYTGKLNERTSTSASKSVQCNVCDRTIAQGTKIHECMACHKYQVCHNCFVQLMSYSCGLECSVTL